MGWIVNNFALRESLESILERIFEIRNINFEVVGGSNGKNHPECRCCKDWRERLVKVDTFHLRYNISAVVQKISVYVVTYLFF